LQLLAGHFQMFAFSCLILFLYPWIYFKTIPAKSRVKFLILLLLPPLLGCIFASPQIVATYELSKISWYVRMGHANFVDYSFEPRMLPTLLFPFIFGGGYAGNYFGAPYMSEMMASVGIFAFASGTWVVAKRWLTDIHVKFWGIVGMISLFLAFGKYTFLYRAISWIPVYNLLRIPARHLFELDFAVAILTALAWDRLWKKATVEKRSVREITLLLLGECALASVCLVNTQIRRAGLFVPLGFAAAYLVTLHLSAGPIFSKRIGSAVLGIIILAEVFLFRGVYFDFDELAKAVPISSVRTEDPVLSFIMTHAGYERSVFADPDSSLSLAYLSDRISVLSGHDPLIPYDLGRFLDLEPYSVSPEWKWLVLRNNVALSLMNTRFLIFRRGDSRIERLKSIYRQVFGTRDFVVMENPKRYPRAFSIQNVKPVKNLDEAIHAIYVSRIDPSKTALVYPDDMKAIGSVPFVGGRAKIDSYDTDRILIQTDFSGPGFLVLSDQYYPGWKAYVDNRETDIYRVDGIVRGIKVPRGQHTIVFSYVPTLLYPAFLAGGICLLACVLLSWSGIAQRSFTR